MDAPKTTDVWVPSPPLSDFVALLWIQDSCVQPHAFERVLPTGTMQVLFSMNPGGRTTNRVVGARSESLVLPASRPFRVIGVHFKPGGGFPFFRVPSGH